MGNLAYVVNFTQYGATSRQKMPNDVLAATLRLLQLLAFCAVSAGLPMLLSRSMRSQMRRSLGIQESSPSQALLENVTPTTTDFDAFIPGAEIWVGSIVALVPIVWATIEFTSRIRVQQACLVCSGSGLVYVTKSGNALSRARKCWNCGGFLPWLGWRRFFLSTFDVGNGGVLQRPAADYDATQAAFREQQQQQQGEDGERESAD